MRPVRRGSAWRALASGAALAWMLFAAVPAAADTKPIRFDHLGPEQGLSQSAVLSIFQDSRGFMWFGTEDGLNRYDGYAFTVYRHDPSDPDSLPIGFVYAIGEDAAGDLWIGTEGGGIARWERRRERFVRFRQDPKQSGSLASDAVRALLVDRRGAVWVGTRDAGLDRLDPRTGVFTHYRRDPADPSSLSGDSVTTLYEDRSGGLWVGTNGGLSRFNPATNSFEHRRHDPANPHSLSEDQVRAVFEDARGALWVGTQHGGLNRLARGGARFEHFREGPAGSGGLSHDSVRAVLEDDSGRLWVGTDGGLNLLQRDAGGFLRYAHDPSNPTGLSDNTVMSIFQDRGGVLWFGTLSGGINKWNPATWSFGHQAMDTPSQTGLSDSNVTAFSVGPEGRLWIGTMGGGLNVLDRTTGRFAYYRNDPRNPRSLSDDRVMALHHDRQGTLWVGTFAGGLNRFDAKSNAFKTYRHDPANPATISANGIMSLFEDSQGVLWVGTFRGGLNRLDRSTESFTRFQNDPANPRSLSNDEVTCIAEGRSGALWIGTNGGGLNLFDRATGHFRSFKHRADDPDSLSANTVFALFVDPSGTLWVGTRGGGLDKLESSTVGPGRARFTHYSQRDGLPNQVIYGIEPDASGNLWLSTNNGLSRFDPRSKVFKNYSASHGLQGNEFHFGAHYRDPRGRLYFGGPGGFNGFAPEQIRSNPHRPPVVLTAVLKANRPARLDRPLSELEALEVGYRDQVVTFEFAGLDYAAPERNRYAYKLEGFDPDWIDLGTVHRVTYTNLDSGRYVLRVKAANNDGVWNEQGLSLSMRVVPPPWRTWWAYLGYGFAVVAALLSVVRAQQRKMAREAEYRQRLELEVKARTQELAERNTELQQLNARLLETSLTDSLTGLRNRRFLFEEVARDVALIQRVHHGRADADGRGSDATGHVEWKPLLFIMVDLDWFKPINDTYGHAAGDRALIQVRSILEKACRNSDVLVRWGGDEFLVVGRNADVDGIEVVPERIRAMIEKTPFDLGDGQVAHLTCSIGFTTDPVLGPSPHILTLEQVVSLADGALYIAKKKAGRNAWVGLLGSENTTSEALLRSLRGEPDWIIEGGHLEVRASKKLGSVDAQGETKPLIQ
jgi:diguanylate cyclase (GGDEF)-like protein